MKAYFYTSHDTQAEDQRKQTYRVPAGATDDDQALPSVEAEPIHVNSSGRYQHTTAYEDDAAQSDDAVSISKKCMNMQEALLMLALD